MAKKGNYHYEYEHPAVAADCVIFGYDKKELTVLLIQRDKEKEASKVAYEGAWALPGGFMDINEDETIAHTAVRELAEETRLVIPVSEMREFRTFSDRERDPRERVISIAHFALVKPEAVQGGTDAKFAKWFRLDEVPHPLAFDHDRILEAARHALRERLRFEPVGFELLPKVFTYPQLFHLYKCILGPDGPKLDRWNMVKKLEKLDIIRRVDDGLERTGSRIPVKYTFNREKYDEYKADGLRMEF